MSKLLDPSVLALDGLAEVEHITSRMRELVARDLHRRGVVLGVSGGIDSAVCLALAVRAFGPSRVVALSMPERESSQASRTLAEKVTEALGVSLVTEDVTGALEALGCYRLRDEAIREVFPAFDGRDWKSKITIAGGIEGGLNFFKLVVQDPAGLTFEHRLPLRPYLQIVAAQSYKQRVRKMVEYFHADRANYAVIGTPNRLEYDQGFFVKNGDGASDLKPIAHLYKTQVYALGRLLGVPNEICNARPTTDTYSLEQSQDEFFFALPYEKMDLALWSLNHDVPAGELATALELTPAQVELVYKDLHNKREATRPLHARPLLVRPVPEVGAS